MPQCSGSLSLAKYCNCNLADHYFYYHLLFCFIILLFTVLYCCLDDEIKMCNMALISEGTPHVSQDRSSLKFLACRRNMMRRLNRNFVLKSLLLHDEFHLDRCHHVGARDRCLSEEFWAFCTRNCNQLTDLLLASTESRHPAEWRHNWQLWTANVRFSYKTDKIQI